MSTYVYLCILTVLAFTHICTLLLQGSEKLYQCGVIGVRDGAVGTCGDGVPHPPVTPCVTACIRCICKECGRYFMDFVLQVVFSKHRNKHAKQRMGRRLVVAAPLVPPRFCQLPHGPIQPP